MKLAVVCTPIGNLGDLAPRAAEVLKSADVVLCEDTRHSRPLLDRVGAHARLLSCHAHNERERALEVIALLREDKRVALVTDAGAPAVSDPGGRLVEDVVAAGVEVEVLPGPSAITAALMGAGVDASRFSFLGFLPRGGRSRASLIDAAARSGFAVVVYEAPQRVEETLADLAAALGPRRVVVARELTKLHETFHRGVLGGALSPPFLEKGEAVIVVEAGEARAEEAVDAGAIAADTSLPPKERAKKLAAALGIPVKDAYERVRRARARPDEVAEQLARARSLLAEAAHALVDADAAAQRERGAPPPVAAAAVAPPVSSEIPGADALLELLARTPALRAPVEGGDAVKAVLGALAALDALDDALAMEAEDRSE